MNIERYKSNGYKDVTKNITPAAADRLYNQVSWQARTPFAPYYRIVLTDPLAGDRIVRDTDHELFGRSTMAPKSVPAIKSLEYAIPFGTRGE